MRSAEAMGKHWCLGCVASSFWPLAGLPQAPTQGRFPIKTIGEAWRQQAHALRQALLWSAHERLQLGQRAHESLASLVAKQQPVLARCGVPHLGQNTTVE